MSYSVALEFLSVFLPLSFIYFLVYIFVLFCFGFGSGLKLMLGYILILTFSH